MSTPDTPPRGSLRVISFAPSITETLYSLSLGERIVGVTRFCVYPPEATKLPSIGGYLDPNYELILGLRPNLVVLLKEHAPVVDFLKHKRIPYLTIDNSTIDGIAASFSSIAAACGVKERGDSLAREFRARLVAKNPLRGRPRLLLCVGRDSPGSGQLGSLFVAGRRTFYDELIELAGAVNASEDSSLSYPSLSAEGVIRLAPEIIVDVMSSVSTVAPERVAADWHMLESVPAVKNGRVHCLTGDYASIPGPRVVLILDELRRLVDDRHIGERG